MTATIATTASAAFAAGVAFGLAVEAWLLHKTTQRLQSRIAELTKERDAWKDRSDRLYDLLRNPPPAMRRRHLQVVDDR